MRPRGNETEKTTWSSRNVTNILEKKEKQSYKPGKRGPGKKAYQQRNCPKKGRSFQIELKSVNPH